MRIFSVPGKYNHLIYYNGGVQINLLSSILMRQLIKKAAPRSDKPRGIFFSIFVISYYKNFYIISGK
ncbi:MAG: hypothetical protein FMNOHCHN_00986 [Ignavibacteriaceae bacterium]|nr:hypothetical protein [Ignavibacteriaceae bacterium]